jgi:hypothetical protein
MEKYGFVYLWYDRKHKRYYLGSHWGKEDDGYVCSSSWMKKAYKYRPKDFKRRILVFVYTNRKDLLFEENRWLSMIQKKELRFRYYNIVNKSYDHWSADEKRRTEIGKKISKTNTGMKIKFKDPSERAQKISETKKRKLAESGGFTQEHRNKLRENRLGTKHTDEWKKNSSEMLKQQWANGIRKPKPKKDKIIRKPGERMKELWADPIWAANQRKKLSENHRSKIVDVPPFSFDFIVE